MADAEDCGQSTTERVVCFRRARPSAGAEAPPAVAQSETWPSGASPDGAPMWEAAFRLPTALLKLPSFVQLGPGILRCPGNRHGVTGRRDRPITDHPPSQGLRRGTPVTLAAANGCSVSSFVLFAFRSLLFAFRAGRCSASPRRPVRPGHLAGYLYRDGISAFLPGRSAYRDGKGGPG
jgi:hypothetical protein